MNNDLIMGFWKRLFRKKSEREFVPKIRMCSKYGGKPKEPS